MMAEYVDLLNGVAKQYYYKEPYDFGKVLIIMLMMALRRVYYNSKSCH